MHAEIGYNTLRAIAEKIIAKGRALSEGKAPRAKKASHRHCRASASMLDLAVRKEG
jgi:hypothetical protein